MKKTCSLILVSLLAGCLTEVEENPQLASAPPLRCDPEAPFGPPKQVGSISSDQQDFAARLSPDELTVYFTRAPLDHRSPELHVATRLDPEDDFADARPIAELSSGGDDRYPTVTADGLTLYFQRDKNIGRATRSTTSDPFGPPSRVELPLPGRDDHFQWRPYLTPKALMFLDIGPLPGPERIASAPVLPDGSLGPAEIREDLEALVVSGGGFPMESADGLRAYWSTDDGRFLSARRASPSASWHAPHEVPELSNAGFSQSWISADDCVLYLNRLDADRAFDIWVARRPL